jgi:hypothetical protein
MPPDGSMGPIYVLQFLYCEKLHNANSTEFKEKISTDFESLEFHKFFDAGVTKSKKISIKLATNGTACFKKCKQLFEYQHSYLETSGGKTYNLYLNVVQFFNTSVD